MSEVKYHHEEVLEIMVSPPGWGLKWGNFMIFSILVLLLSYAYLFKYPDTLNLPVNFPNPNLISVIRAPEENVGIDTFLVKNRSLVSLGQPLFVWYDKQHSSYAEIIKLEKIITDYQQNRGRDEKTKELLIKRFYLLSSVKLGSLNQEYQHLLSAILNHKDAIDSDLTNLAVLITNWKSKYIVQATIGGKVALNYLFRKSSRPLAAKMPLLSIQPTNTSSVVSGKISNELFSKVKLGQQAYITIGEVTGKKLYGMVTAISPIEERNSHDVYIQLKEVPELNSIYTGKAKIILENRSLLLRVFNPNHF